MISLAPNGGCTTRPKAGRQIGAMRKLRTMGVLAFGLLLQGCALFQTQDDGPEQISDPLEGMNRFFFDVNERIDRHAALPVTNAYNENVPQRVRGTFHNVLENLGGPVTV